MRCPAQDAKDAKIPAFGNFFQQPRWNTSKHRPPGGGRSGRTCVAKLEPNLCRCTCATRLFGKDRLKFASESKGSFLASSFEEKQVVCATWTHDDAVWQLTQVNEQSQKSRGFAFVGSILLYVEVRLLPFACGQDFVPSLSV